MALPALEPFTGDGALSANWTQQNTTPKVVRVANQAAGDTAANAAQAYWNADAFTADQYSQVVVKVRATGQYCGPIVRATGIGDGNQNAYMALDGNSVGNVELWKIVAGVFTQLKVISQAVVVNDILRLEVRGTTLVVKLNGAQIGTSTTDSSLATGSAGLTFGDSTPRVDDWEGGNISGGLLFRGS